MVQKNDSAKNIQDSIRVDINRLQKAEDDMMDWMKQYKVPDKNLRKDQALDYLNIQLKNIQEVKASIAESFKQSNELLTQIKHQTK